MKFKRCSLRMTFEQLNALFGLPEGVEVVGVGQTELTPMAEFTIVSTLPQPLPEFSLQAGDPLTVVGQHFLNPPPPPADKGGVVGKEPWRPDPIDLPLEGRSDEVCPPLTPEAVEERYTPDRPYPDGYFYREWPKEADSEASDS